MTDSDLPPAPGPGSPGPGAAVWEAAELPAAVAGELTRISRRWAQLDLPRAAGALPLVRALSRRYAAHCHPGVALPDLGPAVAVDQLTVVTYDALAAGVLDGGQAAADLADVRRCLP